MDITPNASPNKSHDSNQSEDRQIRNETESVESREVALNSLDFNTGATTSFEPIVNTPTVTYFNENDASSKANTAVALPTMLLSKIASYNNPTITRQPFPNFGALPSPISLNITLPNQPQSLFLQALSKLNDSDLSLTVLNHLKTINTRLTLPDNRVKDGELSPPDSLTSAPPSYSFVLRQMANRRRPRLMGTFIPSPSFVQHTPPPNYAAAFDIYVDNPMPPPPPRIYNFGFTPIPAVCPECGYTGITVTTSKITLCTHLCAFILCLFCCWVCAPLPYVLRSCKDVYHYCRNCRTFLGMYCATNPENTYP